jgi:hypothetical protein
VQKPSVKRGRNRPIDRMRDSGGSAKIPEGNGTLVGSKVIGSRIYFLAEKGVTSAVFADHVDPDRTNPDIPFVVQRQELNYGLDTIFIQRTLCVAFKLVDETYLPTHVSNDEILNLALKVARALASIVDVTKEFEAHQANVREPQSTTAYLPHTNNLDGKVQESLAHLREVEISIKKMTVHFYPKAAPNDSWCKDLIMAIQERSSDQDFIEHFHELKDFLRAVGDHRNAMIHPDTTKSITLTDYELQANGSIVAPTIEILHPQSSLPRQDVAHFLQLQVDSISYVYETFLAWLCDLNARVFNDMFHTHVAALPEGVMHNGSKFVWQTQIKEGYENIQGKIDL